MSATNKTSYYELPVFIGTDVPSWLGDWNNAMNAIDGAINGVKTSADNAKNVADAAEGKRKACRPFFPVCRDLSGRLFPVWPADGGGALSAGGLPGDRPDLPGGGYGQGASETRNT